MQSFKAIGNGQVPMFAEEPACAKYCPNISFKQRIIGFGTCFGIGWVLAFAGTLTLLGGTSSENLTTFAILYVLGNVTALCATGFLLGPRSQCRQMFHPTRRYTTVFYLIMLIIVLSVALAKVNIGVVLAMLFLQIMAGFWYSISYIPFARKIIISFLKRTICKPCADVYDQSKEAVGGEKKGFSFLEDK